MLDGAAGGTSSSGSIVESERDVLDAAIGDLLEQALAPLGTTERGDAVDSVRSEDVHVEDSLDEFWAFAALTRHPAPGNSPTERARGATHHQALRALANRRVGILHGCLQHHTTYDETIAWAAVNA